MFLLINTFAFSQEIFNTITFSLPENIIKLSEEEKINKFSKSGQIPDMAFSDNINNANITLKKTLIPVPDKNLSKIKQAFTLQFSAINFNILENKIINLNGKDYIYIKVISPTIKGNVLLR